MRCTLSQQTKQWHLPRPWTWAAILLAGALLAASVAVSAQAGGGDGTPAKPSRAEKHSKPAKARNSPDSGLPFAKVMREVQKRGRHDHVPNYIAHDLRLIDVSLQLFAYELTPTDEKRVIFVVDEPGSNTALLLTQAGGQEVVYVTNPAELKQAARITTGRLQSKTLHNIPPAAAQDGFKLEKEFWIKLLASGDPVPAALADPAK